MPLPMVHFKTAYVVLSNNAAIGIDQPQYYIGSLAPDGVHSRINYTFLDRSRSHLESKDTLQWFENVDHFLLNYKNSSGFSFYLGYAVHIMTDILWQEKVLNRFHQAYQRIQNPEFSDVRQAYINEMCFLDIQIYHAEKTFRNKIWNFLKQANGIGIQPLVSDVEIEKEKELTLWWYEGRKNNQGVVPKLITIADVYEFIASASDEISHHLRSIIH